MDSCSRRSGSEELSPMVLVPRVAGRVGDSVMFGQVQQLSKMEVEDLLRKGAYGALMDEEDEGSKFCEEDIDQILQRRTQTITIQSEGKGSTFAKVHHALWVGRELPPGAEGGHSGGCTSVLLAWPLPCVWLKLCLPEGQALLPVPACPGVRPCWNMETAGSPVSGGQQSSEEGAASLRELRAVPAWQCALAVQKANYILFCVKGNMTRRAER